MKKILCLIIIVLVTMTMNAQVDFNLQVMEKKDYYVAEIGVTSGVAPFLYHVNGIPASSTLTLQYGETYIISVKDAQNSKKFDTIMVDDPHLSWEISYFGYGVCTGVMEGFLEVGVAVKIYDYDDRDNFSFHWYDLATGLEVDCQSYYEGYVDSLHAYVKTYLEVYDPSFNEDYAIHIRDIVHDMDTVVFINVTGNLLMGVRQWERKTISVYPNPTVSLLNFSDVVSDVRLFSSDGKLLRRYSDVTSIDLAGFPAGIYMISLDGVTKKIIKK